jgi:hypothetical protein
MASQQNLEFVDWTIKALSNPKLYHISTPLYESVIYIINAKYNYFTDDEIDDITDTLNDIRESEARYMFYYEYEMNLSAEMRKEFWRKTIKEHLRKSDDINGLYRRLPHDIRRLYWNCKLSFLSNNIFKK